METFVSLVGSSPKPWIDGLIMYNSFFLSRYVGNDIQNLCGNMFDRPLPKTLILFVVMYTGSRNVAVSIVLTILLIGVQYVMTNKEECKPYKERNYKSSINKNIWVEPAATFIPAPTAACGGGMCSMTPQ
jgi:hypothetical protein